MAENTLSRQFDVAKLREDLYMLEHSASPIVREVARFQLMQLLDWLDDRGHADGYHSHRCSSVSQ